MFSESITARFSDTDALGHINNTMVPVWFEGARDPIFRLFMPELDLKQWQLILAKIDVSFHEQMFYGEPLEVKTYISRIGSSSFDVYQEVWQQQKKCASGTAVMIHFCFDEQSAKKISDDIRALLTQHLYQQSL